MTGDATTALLLALCRAHLTAADRQGIAELLAQPVEWPRLAELAKLHGVVSLARHNLAVMGASGQVPPSVWQDMQMAAAQVALDGMVRLQALRLAVPALQANGVQPILLKGYALAALLYPDPLLRPSADVDLLVQPEELPAACAALETIGGRLPSQSKIAFQRAHSYDLACTLFPLAGRPVLVELHWNLAPRGLLALDLDGWRERSQALALDGLNLRRLSSEDMLLHLALHMRKHRYVGLRWLNDVAELARRSAEYGESQPLDWGYVVAAARQAGMSVLLYTSLSLAQRLLSAPVPAEVLAAVRPSVVRRRLIQATLTQDLLLAPAEVGEAGWTRRAPMEVWLLDRPAAMARELRFRLLPPAEATPGAQAAGRRAWFKARRLASRSATLLRR